VSIPAGAGIFPSGIFHRTGAALATTRLVAAKKTAAMAHSIVRRFMLCMESKLLPTQRPERFADLNPDGTQQPFAVAAGHPIIVTDISIQRETVLPGPTLFAVNITQKPPNAHQLRWAFVASISQNVERSFSTGMVFSTSFFIQNAIEDPGAPAVIVRLWGFTD
jgi:hypothetical protein